MDKWGGQIIFHVGPVLRKIVQVCNFTCSKIFFITFGGAMAPPITNVALPLFILRRSIGIAVQKIWIPFIMQSKFPCAQHYKKKTLLQREKSLQ